MITLRQFLDGSPLSLAKESVSQDVHALTFLTAWDPPLQPFFSLLLMCLRCLILPVPVVFLLRALVDQLYLLFLAWKPPPLWASFLFWRWKFDLPVYLERAWEWVCFKPAAGVPLVYRTKFEFRIIIDQFHSVFLRLWSMLLTI